MKPQKPSDRRDDGLPSKKQSKVEMRLVSPPNQRVIREWDITLPDELVAALTMGNI